MLADPVFRLHVAVVVIDEVHLVSNWGNSFCSAYIELWAVQVLLGRKP